MLLQRIRDALQRLFQERNTDSTAGLVSEVLQGDHVLNGVELPRRPCRTDDDGQISDRVAVLVGEEGKPNVEVPHEGSAWSNRAKTLAQAVGGQTCALAPSLGNNLLERWDKRDTDVRGNGRSGVANDEDEHLPVITWA
jgi:hypothetical protein